MADLIQRGAKVLTCRTCITSRELNKEDLISGVEKGTMMMLATMIKGSHVALSF